MPMASRRSWGELISRGGGRVGGFEVDRGHTSLTSGMKGSRVGSLRPEKVILAVAKQRLRGLV